MKYFVPFATAATLVGTALARPEFQKRVPNGDAGTKPGSGISCSPLGHEGCTEGAPRNDFGLAFKDAGLEWTKERT